MPTYAFHARYWNNTSTAVTPVVVSQGGYPPWQRAPHGFYIGSVIGASQAIWDQIGWLIALAKALHRARPAQRRAIDRAIEATTHPLFHVAQSHVAATAKTLGFNKPHAWRDLSRELHASPNDAENTFRHLRVVHALKAHGGSTLTNPDAHLIAELAYQAYAGSTGADV
jgi:hypothetical protein